MGQLLLSKGQGRHIKDDEVVIILMHEHLPRVVRQRLRRISVFDGQDLKKAMIAGAAWLEEHREAINALNVFPVPDGDTGSNMSATMKAAVRSIATSEETSASQIAATLAHDALLGARGNSGVILSQTLRGLAAGLDKKQTFTATDLANSLQQAADLAYRAVLQPVEGTILTVVRTCAQAAQRSADRGDDIVTLLHETTHAARQAVAHTPELLPLLKQAGVVDAGGHGFYTLLEGISRYARGEATVPTSASATSLENSNAFQHEEPIKKGHVTIEEEFGYEVVFLLRGKQLDVNGIRQSIIDMGGVSTVVAGDDQLLKVHTHTPTPGKILDYGVSLGSLLDINIENLQEQSLRYAEESAAEQGEAFQAGQSETLSQTGSPTQHIATIAVISGTGFEKVFQGLGVHVIVPGGQSMNPSIEELLAAVESVSTDHVILLPNNGNVILSAQQVASLTEKTVYVVPSRTLPQGISAMLAFNFAADFSTNCQAMTAAIEHIQTAEITRAVRSVQIDHLHVREGDIIGLINGRLTIAAADKQAVIDDILHRMDIGQYEILTLYYGQDVSAQEAQETAQRIKSHYFQLEVEVVDGGQPYYLYILSAE